VDLTIGTSEDVLLLLQSIDDRLSGVHDLLQSVYIILGFVVVVGVAAVILYIMLKPIFYFLR
jgi:hypothetical protein